MENLIDFGGKKIFQDHVVSFLIINNSQSDWVVRLITSTKKIFAEEHFKNKLEALIRMEEVSSPLRFSTVYSDSTITDFCDSIIEGLFIVSMVIKQRKNKWELIISFVNQTSLNGSFLSFGEAQKEMIRIVKDCEMEDVILLSSMAFSMGKIVSIGVLEENKEKLLEIGFCNGESCIIPFCDEKELQATYEEIINFSYHDYDDEEEEEE